VLGLEFRTSDDSAPDPFTLTPHVSRLTGALAGVEKELAAVIFQLRGDHRWAKYNDRLFKKAVQPGRSERRAEAYPLGYVEGLSDARTKLEDFSTAC
jgi:hypothetical protein